jgi:TatA/E family protein of Tat protein translocase
MVRAARGSLGPSAAGTRRNAEDTMFGLGWQELMIVLVIIMIIFGAGKLPTLFKDLGSGVKEFKTAVNDDALPGGSTTTTTSATTGETVAGAPAGAAPASDPSRI